MIAKIEKLPHDLLVRRPTQDDLEAVYEFWHAADMHDFGGPDVSLDDIRTEWSMPDFDLARDAWLVTTADGRAIGFAEIEGTEGAGYGKIGSFIAVHPEYRSLDLYAGLLSILEERARELLALASEGARVTLNCGCAQRNEVASRAYERAGYELIRHSWRMEIDMQQAPEAPTWPEGVQMRTFVRGQDERAVFDVVEEAFSDHWGHTPGNYDVWAHWNFERPDFDPSLWFLASEGNEIAGCSLCRYELGIGWVGTLAVRRPWRRKGLGMALLLHSFGEFYRRGTHTVGLGVDSQNLTGAVRLYKRAGMHIARQYDTYQKELRAGRDLATRALEV